MCNKTDCIYRSSSKVWGCDYSDLNGGKCKISRYPHAPNDPLRDKPKECPCYKPGKKLVKDVHVSGKLTKKPVVFHANGHVKYDWTIAKTMYEAGKTDREIAEALSEDRRKRLEEQNNGEPLSEEALKHCNCNKDTVKNWRASHGLVSRHRKPATEDVHGKLLVLYYTCFNDTEIAEKSGYTKNAIYNWRQAHGLPARGTHEGADVLDWDAVLNLIANGVPVAETAAAMHTSVQTIENWLEKRRKTVEQDNKRRENREAKKNA